FRSAARRGEGAELASQFGAVEVSVVALDQALADGQHVAAADGDGGAVGLEPFEADRAVEGRGGAPAHGDLLPTGDQLDDLQLEVREGLEDVAEPGPVGVRYPQLDQAVDLARATGRVEGRHRVEVAPADRFEVGATDGRGVGWRAGGLHAPRLLP